jgi:thymidine kinase
MPDRALGPGVIEVIAGPMFSGKSEELIRRVNRAVIARQKVQVFKPTLDRRYHESRVASHFGRTFEALAVVDALELRHFVDTDSMVVAIDEAQFFDPGVIDACEELAERGARVIVAGLDLDFRGEPFGPMPELLARASVVEKLTAVCMGCGRPATRTQRLVNGKPAPYTAPVILVGAAESYEARCRACHDVPGHPRREGLGL